MKAKNVLLVALLAGLAATASAQSTNSGQSAAGTPATGRGQRHGPPPEAIDACNGKASGAACSFTGRQNEKHNGSCFSPPARDTSANAQTNPPGASSNQNTPRIACRPDRGGAGAPK